MNNTLAVMVMAALVSLAFGTQRGRQMSRFCLKVVWVALVMALLLIVALAVVVLPSAILAAAIAGSIPILYAIAMVADVLVPPFTVADRMTLQVIAGIIALTAIALMIKSRINARPLQVAR
jgi:hypothetical protein